MLDCFLSANVHPLTLSPYKKDMDIILKYYPGLKAEQIAQLEQLEPLYREWNEKINVISRKDIDNLYAHHILHALSISIAVRFRTGANILDLGTGGGLPGIPLAILYPNVDFKLVDGTRKKIKVVNEIVAALGLKNVTAQQVRAEEIKKEKFDFVICRGVAKLDKLKMWSNRLIKRKEQHAIPNGLLALKGGNVREEIKLLPKGEYIELFPLKDYFEEEFYKEKYIVYVQR